MKINNIIDKYQDNEQLYQILKQYYIYQEVTKEEEQEIIEKIKNNIVNYYLSIYKFKIYSSNEIQDDLLLNISMCSDLLAKVKKIDGKFKIYPVKESTENKETIYINILSEMVDYQIENNINIEQLFNIYAKNIKQYFMDFQQQLIQGDMEPYYGSIYYMVEKSLFTIDCIKNIPGNFNLNLEEIENKMHFFKDKYIESRNQDEKEDAFTGVNKDFYNQYDEIEFYYKKILEIENKLQPIVIGYWQDYITNPINNDEDYKYIMHCFSREIVDPSLMNKACCALYTPTIKNNVKGSSGLIYDIDVDSVETMCTDDVGSWVTNKKNFIERGCPSNWQLTNLKDDSIWYEYPYNSKIIMPNVFENECINKIKTGHYYYSEIVLNQNAKPIGVFYTDECQDIDAVNSYAESCNLPLIKIDAFQNQMK